MKISKSFIPLTLLLMIASASLCGSRPARAASPDLMICVEAADPSMALPDQVVLSYPGRTSGAVMREDIEALRHETGWSVQDLKLEPGMASFTTRDAISRATGRLPVSQVVTALRRYRHLIAVFDVLGTFTYTGHTYYRDANVEIAMERQVPGSKTFGFHVTLGSSATGRISMGDDVNPKSPLSPLRISLALLAAALIGFAVYLLFLRTTSRTEPAASPCDK